MPATDPLDAIDAASIDASDTGHDLRGFSRRSGSFGYRFEAQCHRCGAAVTVRRGQQGWDHDRTLQQCTPQSALMDGV